MKVLVTGVSGFVGSHVVTALLKQGCQVIGTGREISKIDQYDWKSKIDFRPFDFAKLETNINYYTYFDQPDAIIHLAWSGLPNYRAVSQIEDNLMPHFSFLKNLIQNGLKNINVTGTCLEYGDYSGELTEDLNPKPNLAYPIAKNALRVFLEQLKNDFEFSLKWIRLFYVYGKGQNPRSLVPLLLSAIDKNLPVFDMSGGEQLRDFIPIEDAARIITRISLQNNVSGIINCSSGIPTSVRNLIEKIIAEKGSKIKLNLGHYPYPTYEPMAFWGSTDKLKKILQ